MFDEIKCLGAKTSKHLKIVFQTVGHTDITTSKNVSDRYGKGTFI